MSVPNIWDNHSIIRVDVWQVAPSYWNYVERSLKLMRREGTKAASVMFTYHTVLMLLLEKNGPTISSNCNTSLYNHTWIV